MSVYKFKLPDIGEGIAEAEIVAWHVKLGDMIEEDAALADMMTDKATVEMESPVAGTVTKLAGEVGDLIAIGSVLVEIETAGSDAQPVRGTGEQANASAVESRDEQPLGDGAVVATAAMAKELPTSATQSTPPAGAGGKSAEREGEGLSNSIKTSPPLRPPSATSSPPALAGGA